MSEQQKVAAELAKFPSEFGLVAFPGQKFRINQRASYFSADSGVQVVLQILNGGEWLDFTRDNAKKIRKEIA